jgi:hypothetical protein
VFEPVELPLMELSLLFMLPVELFMSEELDGLEVVPPISFFFMLFMQVEKPLSPLWKVLPLVSVQDFDCFMCSSFVVVEELEEVPGWLWSVLMLPWLLMVPLWELSMVPG